MKITVLVENTCTDSLKCEHGLSLLIEHNNIKILLDSGSTEVFAENAVNMGVDLSQVDIGVLSHGHYDHSGGFEIFFKKNQCANVYTRKSAFEKYYSTNGYLHEIGIPDNVLCHKIVLIRLRA